MECSRLYLLGVSKGAEHRTEIFGYFAVDPAEPLSWPRPNTSYAFIEVHTTAEPAVIRIGSYTAPRHPMN
jgi:hypothetical protein